MRNRHPNTTPDVRSQPAGPRPTGTDGPTRTRTASRPAYQLGCHTRTDPATQTQRRTWAAHQQHGTSHRRDRLEPSAPRATVTFQHRAKSRHETATATQSVPDSDRRTRAAVTTDSDCLRTAAGSHHDPATAPAAPATAADGRATANQHGGASHRTTRQGRPALDNIQETNLT